MYATPGNGSPSISVVETYDRLSEEAADAVADVLERTPDAAITVPTGSTPLGMYRELVRRANASTIDLREAHIFCLDDYLGHNQHDEASLTRWLFEAFLIPAKIPERNIHLVPAMAANPETAVAAYEAEIEALGGLRLAVVGLGPNGHVAFNEPGSSPESRTRVVQLTDESRSQSSAYWEGKASIPEQAITMGLGTILDAERIVLIVSGEAKAEMVRRSLEEPPTLEVPGSWLQTAGNRLHVILEREAASALTHENH